MDALISNAGAAIKAMVLTTDDSLEAILAETVAAAEQALREMKGEAAPPPPPPPPVVVVDGDRARLVDALGGLDVPADTLDDLLRWKKEERPGGAEVK